MSSTLSAHGIGFKSDVSVRCVVYGESGELSWRAPGERGKSKGEPSLPARKQKQLAHRWVSVRVHVMICLVFWLNKANRMN